MKQPEVFKKIGGIIQELNEQYEYLQSTADDLNDLELELFVANTHFLKDHAEILRKLNLIKSPPAQLPPHVEPPIIKTYAIPAPPVDYSPEPNTPPLRIDITPFEIKPEPVAEKPASAEPKYFEPLVQQKPIAAPFKPEQPKPIQKEPIQFEIAKPADEPTPQIDLGSSAPEDSYSYEREETETIRHELVLDDTHDWDEEEDDAPIDEDEVMTTPEYIIEPEEQVTEAEEPIPTNPEPVIDNTPKITEEPKAAVADDKPLSLNQRLAAKLKESTTAQATTEPAITDIKAAINLNDKMLFIKDLFNGYPLAYSEAVEIVNRFSSFDEADRFLKKNYVLKNNWDAKKTASDKFYALLRRRYA